MAEQSKPSSSSSSSSSSSTAAAATAGEEDEDKDARSLVSYPKLLPDSCLVRNPRVVPSTKKPPLSQEEAEEGEGRGEVEVPHPRGTKRLRKNRPKALDKIHPSDDDEEGDENLPLFSFGTRAYSPQFTPKFGSFVGGAEEGGEERKERRE